MKKKRGNAEHFLFTLIDQLFPGDGESTGQDHMVSDRLFYGLLTLATLIAILLGLARWIWMSE